MIVQLNLLVLVSSFRTLKREKGNRQNSRTVAEESEKKREFLLQKSKQYSRQIDALKVAVINNHGKFK